MAAKQKPVKLQLRLDDETLWREVLIYKIKNSLPNNSEAVTALLRKALGMPPKNKL